MRNLIISYKSRMLFDGNTFIYKVRQNFNHNAIRKRAKKINQESKEWNLINIAVQVFIVIVVEVVIHLVIFVIRRSTHWAFI